MKKKVALGLVLTLGLTMVAGCGNSSSTTTTTGGSTPQAEVINIGGLAPLSGEVAVYGLANKNGAELAFGEINNNGGVLGSQINFETLDEKGDVTEAINAYNKIADNIVALLGDVTSKPTAAVAEAAAADRMPMVTATATAAVVTSYGDNIFRVCFLDPFQGKTMATFAAENLEAKTAAVLRNVSDDYSDGLATAFIETAGAMGLEIVANESYGKDDVDFKTQLTSISKLNPDVVFIPDYYSKVALVAAQAKEVGCEAVLLGADGWDGVLTTVSDAAVLEGAYFCNHYSLEDESDKVQNFIANYTATYGAEPNAFAALAYDAAYILSDAIERAGSTDNEAIIEALKNTSYEGVTGHITFDENGDPIKSVAIIKITEGAYTLETKVTAN